MKILEEKEKDYLQYTRYTKDYRRNFDTMILGSENAMEVLKKVDIGKNTLDYTFFYRSAKIYFLLVKNYFSLLKENGTIIVVLDSKDMLRKQTPFDRKVLNKIYHNEHFKTFDKLLIIGHPILSLKIITGLTKKNKMTNFTNYEDLKIFIDTFKEFCIERNRNLKFIFDCEEDKKILKLCPDAYFVNSKLELKSIISRLACLEK